ncbi:hypothetical protein [Sessilibacter sp. MAH1]
MTLIEIENSLSKLAMGLDMALEQEDSSAFDNLDRQINELVQVCVELRAIEFQSVALKIERIVRMYRRVIYFLEQQKVDVQDKIHSLGLEKKVHQAYLAQNY